MKFLLATLETLSAIASAFGVNVSVLSEETYVASQALNERISEAKIQVVQEPGFIGFWLLQFWYAQH